MIPVICAFTVYNMLDFAEENTIHSVRIISEAKLSSSSCSQQSPDFGDVACGIFMASGRIPPIAIEALVGREVACIGRER